MAEWLGEVLGGPPRQPRPARTPVATLLVGGPVEGIGEPERARLVTLVLRSARQTSMPTDPEFWSAFTACVEWLSQQGTADTAAVRWDWGPAGPPRPAIQPVTDTATAEVTLPGEGEQTSFARHIRPLFRQRDQQAMSFAFDLLSYDDVRTPRHRRSSTGCAPGACPATAPGQTSRSICSSVGWTREPHPDAVLPSTAGPTGVQTGRCGPGWHAH